MPRSDLKPLDSCSLLTSFLVTRTHKENDRDHVGIANGTAGPQERLPRYFSKTGHAGVDPSSTKKQGGGKGNWGVEGISELEDYNYNMNKQRKRTNSSTQAAGHSLLKTKFEAIDPEAIDYEEELHGPQESEIDAADKMSTSSSAETMDSVEEK